jgi:hypothetical protein
LKVRRGVEMRKDKRSISVATVLAALIVLIWSAGVSEAADPPLWPLQEGQWMEFLVQSPDQALPWKAQIKVVGAKAVGDNQYFGVEIPEWGQGTQGKVFLRSTEKGLFRLEAEGECPVAEVDQFGTSFRCRTGAGGWEVSILLAQVALTVPAGTFTTARLFRKHIEYDNGSMSPDWDVYIVPGVGPVKQVEYAGNFDGQSAPGVARTIELVQVGMSPEVFAESMQSVPAIPDAKAESPSSGAEGTTRRVATLGVVVEVRESSFTLRQESLKVSDGKKAIVRSVKHHLAIGYVDNHLEISTDNATQITMGGALTTLSALRPGTRVIVAGMNEGEILKAVLVSDLSSVGPTPEEVSKPIIQSKDFAVPIPSAPVAVQEEPTPGTVSMCLGQNMDYDYEPHVLEFQGCWGGPSVSGTIPTYDVSLGVICPVLACGPLTLHDITYTAALAGWGFDFPYRFFASSSDLTYHTPSIVFLNIEPLKATDGEFTFWGGIGFSFDLDINFMGFDFVHIPIDFLSTIHQATGPAPIKPGQTLHIEEAACPGVDIEIPETEIPLLTLKSCADLTMEGWPFNARVTAKGNNNNLTAHLDFDGSARSLNPVMPDSATVDVQFDQFRWVPGLSVGFYVGVESLKIPVFKSPKIDITSGAFMAITTPFPSPDSLMTVATDPDSPIDARKYLYQPTLEIIQLPVKPASTRLAIISANALLEGEPIQALLQEDRLGVPIPDQAITFTTALPGGQAGITVRATTGTDGIARAIFPAGEHMALHAVWGGSSYYRAFATGISKATISAAPDLKGEWIALDRKCRWTKKGANCRISGKLKIENIGSLKAPKSVVRFYLSDDKVYDQGDTLLKQMAVGSLGAGKSSTKPLNYTIPSGGTAGGKYIIAVIDADNAVVEYKGDNHVVFGPFEVIVF